MNDECERMTVKMASELTGMSALTIRYGIENGELEFGRAIHIGKQRTIFHISPRKLYEYLGLLEKNKEELNPMLVADTKVFFLDKRVIELEKTVNELKLVINSLLDNQEYIIKKINGESTKGYSFDSIIMSFRQKSVYIEPEETVTVKRAAELLGKSTLTIQYGLINGEFPFGTVTQKELYNGKHQNVFHIFAKKLSDYLGITVEEVKEPAKLPDKRYTKYWRENQG